MDFICQFMISQKIYVRSTLALSSQEFWNQKDLKSTWEEPHACPWIPSMLLMIPVELGLSLLRSTLLWGCWFVLVSPSVAFLMIISPLGSRHLIHPHNFHTKALSRVYSTQCPTGSFSVYEKTITCLSTVFIYHDSMSYLLSS